MCGGAILADIIVPSAPADHVSGGNNHRRTTADHDMEMEAAFQEQDTVMKKQAKPSFGFAAATGCGRRPRLRLLRSSQYYGVRRWPGGKWAAEVRDPVGGARLGLRTFATADDAARAYDHAARDQGGHNAKLNFPSAPTNTAPCCVDLVVLEDDENDGVLCTTDNNEAPVAGGCGALPDFSWQGMSAADDMRVELGHGAKETECARTEPQDQEVADGNEVAQAPSHDPATVMLLDAFM